MKLRYTTALLLIVAACGSRGDDDAWRIDMDPRLANLAAWSYACMLDVTGLAAINTLPAPNVQGVDEPWGDGNIGTFYHSSRSIRVQITRPESHVVRIINHENGHDADWRLHGKKAKDNEDYANWVEQQCRENAKPDIYPAPRIDWEAK